MEQDEVGLNGNPNHRTLACWPIDTLVGRRVNPALSTDPVLDRRAHVFEEQLQVGQPAGAHLAFVAAGLEPQPLRVYQGRNFRSGMRLGDCLRRQGLRLQTTAAPVVAAAEEASPADEIFPFDEAARVVAIHDDVEATRQPAKHADPDGCGGRASNPGGHAQDRALARRHLDTGPLGFGSAKVVLPSRQIGRASHALAHIGPTFCR